jgi:glycosyltransferase involved in cell wall biosynthesis
MVAGKLGPGEENHLRVGVRRHRIEADVVATGYIPDGTLARLYQLCDLFVFPSLYEGFGLPALEAMRCGARVLVADVSSLPELVRDPGARFDPRSVDAIRLALERGLTDSAFRARLQAMAPLEAKRFSWDRATTEALRAYAFAIRRRAGLRR